jgi:hypothetical protein
VTQGVHSATLTPANQIEKKKPPKGGVQLISAFSIELAPSQIFSPPFCTRAQMTWARSEARGRRNFRSPGPVSEFQAISDQADRAFNSGSGGVARPTKRTPTTSPSMSCQTPSPSRVNS